MTDDELKLCLQAQTNLLEQIAGLAERQLVILDRIDSQLRSGQDVDRAVMKLAPHAYRGEIGIYSLVKCFDDRDRGCEGMILRVFSEKHNWHTVFMREAETLKKEYAIVKAICENMAKLQKPIHCRITGYYRWNERKIKTLSSWGCNVVELELSDYDIKLGESYIADAQAELKNKLYNYGKIETN